MAQPCKQGCTNIVLEVKRQIRQAPWPPVLTRYGKWFKRRLPVLYRLGPYPAGVFPPKHGSAPKTKKPPKPVKDWMVFVGGN
jgi:hypothetical protein